MTPSVQLVIASILLSRVHLSTLRPTQSTPCGDTDVQSDNTCPENCFLSSVLAGDKTDIPCKIKGSKVYDKFLLENKQGDLFDSPSLKSMNFFWKTFPAGEKAASLNVTFQLPIGNLTPEGKPMFPKALLLKLQNTNNPEDHYHDCPIKRLFIILEYKVTNTFDFVNPRSVSYDCLVGLDQNKPKAVYNLTLGTAEGRHVVYTVVIPMDKKALGEAGPVIATRYDPEYKQIHVIVEYAANMTECDVSVENTESKKINSAKLKKPNNTHTFGTTTGSSYIVRVRYTECDNCTTTSDVIATNIPLLVNDVNGLEQIHMAVILGVAAGICVIVIIVAAFYVRIHKKQGQQNSFPSHQPNNQAITVFVAQDFQPAPSHTVQQESIPNSGSAIHRLNTIENRSLLPTRGKYGGTKPCTCRDYTSDSTDETSSKLLPEIEGKNRGAEFMQSECSCGSHLPHSDETEVKKTLYDDDFLTILEKANLRLTFNREGCDTPLRENRSLLSGDVLQEPDSFSISSDGSLWERDSEPCCRGRHGEINCCRNRQRNQSSSHIQGLRGSIDVRSVQSPCPDDSRHPTDFDTYQSNEHKDLEQQNAIVMIRRFNLSGETARYM